jgi:hypothetical protein
LIKAFVYDASIIHMGKVPPQQTVIVMTAAATVTIVMSISAVAMMMIPQTAAYATQDEKCDPNEYSVRIDGAIRCIGEEECESYEFERMEVKHCDY